MSVSRHCTGRLKLAHGVTKLLVKADAHPEVKISITRCSPLNLAAEEGHSHVMRVLVEAGADPNNRDVDGTTPLYRAAWRGQLAATKVLLHAKADPLFACSKPSGNICVPLEVAAQNRHLEVTSQLFQEHGIECCGGTSGAREQHVEITLTSAGVVDTDSKALIADTKSCREASVRLLLQQHQGITNGDDAYVNTRDRLGGTPFFMPFALPAPRRPELSGCS